MVMCGVRLQSQRRILLIRQGLQFFQVVRTMLGPQRGVDRDSGVVVAPENRQIWTDVGGFDLDKKCIVGGDQGEADRGELADRSGAAIA